MARKRNTGLDSGVSVPRAPRAVSRNKHAAAPQAEGQPLASGDASPVAAATLAEPAPMVATPAHEDIARLAYALWEARGGEGGSPEEDWQRAEEQLRTSRSQGDPLPAKAAAR